MIDGKAVINEKIQLEDFGGKLSIFLIRNVFLV